MPNTIGSTPPSSVDAQLAQKKGTRVADMPDIKGGKKPPSMAQTVRDAQAWLSDPWRKAAETKSLIQRGVAQLLGGDALGQRNAAAANQSVEWSLQALKEASRVEGMADALLPPPKKHGGQSQANPASPAATEAAKKLSQIFNRAALSFRDAAASRPLPQFRFRGTPPDERWTLGALNTDLLKSTLLAQLTGTGRFASEEPAELVHALNLLLLSDHTLTPGAVAFCEEIRDTLGVAAAERGPLQRGELQLKEMLQAANNAQSAYVRVKDVIAYANARQADIGPRLAAALQPSEATLLAAIKAKPEGFAELPESTRGQLREACRSLFGAEETKEIFTKVDDKRLSTTVDPLKFLLEKLPTDTRAAAMQVEQAAVLARRIGAMKSDLPKALVKQATVDIIASAAGSMTVRAQGDRLAKALVSANAGEISAALTTLKPLLNLLSSLPEANDEQIAKAFMAGSLEQFSLSDLDKFQAVLFAKPDPSAPPAEALTLFKRGLGGVMNASKELRKVSSHIESAQKWLISEEPGAAQALSAALKKIAQVVPSTLADPRVSNARRQAVQNEIEALRASLRSAPDELVAHFDAIDDIREIEGLHHALTGLAVFAPPVGERKSLGQADVNASAQARVEAHLRTSQGESQATCAIQLQSAVDALAAPFTPDTAQRVLRALAIAAQAESVSHPIQRLLGTPVAAATWRTERMAEVQVDASALTEDARAVAQDLAALLATISKPAGQQERSALGDRLDSLKAYLKGFGLTPTEAISGDRLRAAATTLQQVCGIRIAHGVPIDDGGLHRHMQSTLNEMLAAAQAEKQGEGASSAVAGQAQKDLGRTTIRLERNGQVEALHEAVAAGGPAGGAAPSTIAERLTQELGANGLRFTSPFMTQEVLGAIVGQYLNANPDSPLRHQFGERAQADVRDAATEVTIVPGEGSTAVRLSVRKDDCRDVKRDADVIDLDPENSHIHMGVEMEIQNDGSGVALRNFTFDMRMTELPPTAQAAAHLYVDSFRAIAPGPGANAEPDLRDAVRERALARLRDINPPPADMRAHAKSVVADEFRRIPTDRRLGYLEQALAVLPANDSVAPTDLLDLGVHDAIRQEYFATVHGIELSALGALNAPNHTVNGTDIGVAEDLWKDFSRLNHYELRLAGRPTIAYAGAGDDTQGALSTLKAMAVGLGATEQAGREKLARIGKYAHQGIWPMILRPHFSTASPLKLNGRPGGWVGPHRPAQYLIEPLENGAHRVTCTMRWRSTPDLALNFMYDGGEMEELSSDSYAQGRIVLRVGEDGSVQLEEPPTVQCQFLPKPTTVLGRLDQALRSINPPSL